eukprot:Phypoly_transcript_20800.p1 GENE.Phypoly_transcript_20800~~Phypoly_transcript_20800.p1  ORF type:complete len:204 (+),score=23.23 Phypoly_transcript_20800:33-614(+)
MTYCVVRVACCVLYIACSCIPSCVTLRVDSVVCVGGGLRGFRAGMRVVRARKNTLNGLWGDICGAIMASATVNVNKAEIKLPKVPINVRVRTNSSFLQKVKVQSASKNIDTTFSGKGENNLSAGVQNFTGDGTVITAVFDYVDNSGKTVPSQALNAGGPYNIGSYNLLVIVAENGDDADFNDAILEFSWKTPK